MKIVLLGHQDIASIYALDMLVRQAPGHDYTVFWSGSMAARKDAAPTLDALDAIDRELFDRYLAESATPGLFEEAAELPAPNAPQGLDALERAGPELVVSIRYRRILKAGAIDVPARGVLNLHSGILPDYRGVMATFWAMLAGEREIGTTLHCIVDAGIDTGPVIAIRRQPADYSSTYLANVLALYRDGCAQIAQAIEDIDRTGSVTSTDQPRGAGHYYGPPTEADAAQYIKKGLKLADGTEFPSFRTLVRNS